MSRSRWILAVAFAFTVAVGGVAGFAIARRIPPARPHDSWLENKLDLTPEQREQMREIFRGALDTAEPQFREQRDSLQHERDEALRQLMTGIQYVQYEEVMKTYSDRLAALDAAKRKVFEDASALAREKVLTPEQREKYDELMREHSSRRGRRGPSGPPPPADTEDSYRKHD